jgi:hypothetical protein
VGPRAGLDVCEKFLSHRDSIPGPFSPQSAAIPTELPGPPQNSGVTTPPPRKKIYVYATEQCVTCHRIASEDVSEENEDTSCKRV